MIDKGQAILDALRHADVGDQIIVKNSDGSIWAILKVVVFEHPEDPV